MWPARHQPRRPNDRAGAIENERASEGGKISTRPGTTWQEKSTLLPKTVGCREGYCATLE